MKKTTVITTAMIFGALILSSGLVIAKDAPVRGPIPFATWDADSNGSIDEKEFNAVRDQRQQAAKADGRQGQNMANAKPFAEIDTDKDGNISADELTVHQQSMQQNKRGGKGKQQSMNRGNSGKKGMKGKNIASQNGQGKRYQAMDEATRQKHDEFRTATTELRKEIAEKRAEKQAVMRSANPDPDQAALLTRQLLELRSQMSAEAEKAGIALRQGKGCGNGHGGKGHGKKANS